jgi:ABC-2 type transport system permease protein
VESFCVLFNKEFKGQLRTYRLLIIASVFLIFGLGTPLLLKYLHALIPAEEATVLPEFTAVDAVKGYLNTLGQVGLIAAILMAMGMVSRERETGTAATTLSKLVGCGNFLLAKLVVLVLTFGLAIAVGAIGCYFYTLVLFGEPGGLNFLSACLIGGLYLLFCLAVTLMYSSFFRSQLAAGGLALVTLVAIMGTAGLPVMEDYSPGALPAWSQRIASGSGENPWGVLIVSVVLIVVTTVIGWQVFRRKEL